MRPMERREFLRVSAVTGLAAVAGTLNIEDALARRDRHLWGALVDPRNGQDARQAIRAFERTIDRKLGVTRHYAAWDLDLPTALIDWSAHGGRTPYVALHAWTQQGDVIPWIDIAEGRHDATLRRQAHGLRSAGYRMIFCFHHEPETDTSNGSASDFKAATHHVRKVFDDERVHNLTYVVNLSHNTYKGKYGGADAWMPRKFDWVGVDGYNRWPLSQPTNESFHDLFAAAHRYARHHGKKMFIGEVGTIESDDPMHKARWIDGARATAKHWNIAGMVYSQTAQMFEGDLLNYWVDSSRHSLRAYRAAGHDRFFT
jgi:hypothetical protein